MYATLPDHCCWKIADTRKVTIGDGAEKRMVNKKVWASKSRISLTGTAILFDGNKLAWSKADLGEKRTMVDLDAEQGRTGHDTNRNSFRLVIRKTKTLDVGASIQGYLSGQISMNESILEAINFLDHLIRENPS
jgi:eukaryotic translation initiation factor 2C